MNLRKMSLFVLTCLLAALFTACTPTVPTITGAEYDQVLQFSEPIADNLFAGLKAGNYAMFSRDFDASMQKGLPESAFSGLTSSLAKVGAYQSRTVDHIEKPEGYYVVVYNAQFEQDVVTVRLTLTQSEPHLISGIWFNSSKLSQ